MEPERVWLSLKLVLPIGYLQRQLPIFRVIVILDQLDSQSLVQLPSSKLSRCPDLFPTIHALRL
jgi:hypothetical protein